jgi:hypothetical protein
VPPICAQAWLNPRDLPANERLTCAHCAQPLRFLLQVYAPLDDVAHAFHRTLYVFCCENGSCLSHAGSMRVLRAQLPRRNEFYGYEPADVESGTVGTDDGSNTAPRQHRVFAIIVHVDQKPECFLCFVLY